MKTWAKVALGILATPVVLLIGGVSFLVVTGRLQAVTGLAGGALHIKRGVHRLQALDHQFPFTPPPDGRMSEARLLAYLKVCEAVRPVAAPFQAWVNAQRGRHGGLNEARTATTQLGDILDKSTRALVDQRMSPEEFQWFTSVLRRARQEVAEKAGSPVAREMLDTLHRLAQRTDLPALERQKLNQKIEAWDLDLRRAGQPLNGNDELYLKYQERIRTLDVDQFMENLAEP